jgi:cytochrome c oxidase assembly protein subunit 15
MGGVTPICERFRRLGHGWQDFAGIAAGGEQACWPRIPGSRILLRRHSRDAWSRWPGSGALTIVPAMSPSQRPVVGWLLLTAAMVFAMAVIGAITRLTESGLSMVEWRPLVGALPPLTEADWQTLFAEYRRTPEFQKVNAWMELADFKSIFWWEYVHRLWGRLIGLVFALPLIWFWGSGRLAPWLKPWLLLVLALGALQGAVGWWMVASGLVEDPHVSHARLALHLGLAVAIYGLVLMLVERMVAVPRVKVPAWLRRTTAALAGFAFVVILSGALVAGLDAGLIYNTFPLMGGEWVPDEVALAGDAATFLSTPAAVQFLHRWLAVALAAAILVVWASSRGEMLAPAQRRPLALLAAMALLQVALGVSTLLLLVPTGLAAAHQAGALVLFGLAVWSAARLRHT